MERRPPVRPRADSLVADPLTVDELDADLTYRCRPVETTDLVPVPVLKACQCYAYQACEHPGWSSRAAHAIIQALASRATFRLPGYTEAPLAWTRTRADQAGANR